MRASEWGLPLQGISIKETWTEGSFTGNPKDMLSRLWKWGSVFIGAPLLRNVDGRSFSRAFERRESIFI
jgi:hypothetical protein